MADMAPATSTSIVVNPAQDLIPLGDVVHRIQIASTAVTSSIQGMRKQAPKATLLSSQVQNASGEIGEWLKGKERAVTAVKDALDNYFNALQDTRVALNERFNSSTIKRRLDKILGKRPDVFESCAHSTDEAYLLLKSCINISSKPPSSPLVPSEATVPNPETPTPAPLESAPVEKRNERYEMALDIVEKGLEATSAVTGFIPEPAGSIVKLVSSAGLQIVAMLKGIASNNAEAITLAHHIAELVDTIHKFLRDPDGKVGSNVNEQLDAFRGILDSIAKELSDLRTQKGWKQAITHDRIKGVLQDCETKIDRSSRTLQTTLSLDALRLLTRLEGAEARAERDRLLEILGRPETGATDKVADPADRMCFPGTRKEVFDQVSQWVTNPSSERIMWINGAAGRGKSALAASIAHQHGAAAEFCFSRSNQPRNDRAVCSLARQIASWNQGSLERFVLKSVRDTPTITSSFLTTQFRDLLVGPLKKVLPDSPTILIVIDALDEWANEKKAAALVEAIRSSDAELPRQVKFVFTSRKERHLVNAFHLEEVTAVVKSTPLDDVPDEQVDRDIQAYLVGRFNKMPSRSGGPSITDWLGEERVQSLVMLSGRLFQWAATIVEYVAGGSKKSRIEEILREGNRYSGLDALYRGILRSLFPAETTSDSVLALLKSVLGMIVIAPTPISLDILAYLSADADHPEDRISDDILEEVLKKLGSFLVVPDNPSYPIRVLHPSILDFLTSTMRCSDARFYINPNVHHPLVAALCFLGMRRRLKPDICEVNDPSKLNSEFVDRIALYIPSGLRYACRYWAHHLVVVSSDATSDLPSLLDEFCNKHLLTWLEVVTLTGELHHTTSMASQVEEWMSKCHTVHWDHAVKSLLRDAQRFIARFSPLISTCVAHIYISALANSPMNIELLRVYPKTFKYQRVLRGPSGRHWPAIYWIAAGHTEGVYGVAFSPDGTALASASKDHTVRLWDVQSGIQRGDALIGHTNWVLDVEFSPDGTTLASGSGDRTVRLWDVQSGIQRGGALIRHTGGVHDVEFSPDGTTLASASADHTIRLWDVQSGIQRGDALVGHTEWVSDIEFSPDGTTLASASGDHTIRLWDVQLGIQRGDALIGHTGVIHDVEFSPDGTTLASASSDHTVRLWDVRSGIQRGDALVGHTDDVNGVKFSPDGTTLASASGDQTICLWDMQLRIQRGDALVGHTSTIYDVEFSPDGTTLASASSDHTVRLWDVQSGIQRGDALIGHTDWVNDIEFSSDGTTLASVSSDHTVRLWDVQSGIQRGDAPIEHTDMIFDVELSSDGMTLASASCDHTLRLWDVQSGIQRGDALVGHTDWVHDVEFSPDSTTLASASHDRTLRLWDVQSAIQKGDALVGHTDVVSDIEFSPDGTTLASASCDHTVRLWDAQSGTQRGDTLVGHTYMIVDVVFSPDGTTLASASGDHTVRLWDVQSGIQRGDALVGHTDWVHHVGFSLDGTTLASASSDRTVRLWDVQSGQQKGEAISIESLPSGLAFTADGQRLVLSTESGSTTQIHLPMASLFQPLNLLPNMQASALKNGHRTARGQVDADGWVYHNGKRWFWLSQEFGRPTRDSPHSRWELHEVKVIIWQHATTNFYILDVSDILYIIDEPRAT